MSIHEENAGQLKTMYENLKLLRERKNWSIDELSQLSGIDVKVLSSIENEDDFEIDVLFKLCRIYGIKVHQIFMPLCMVLDRFI